MTEELLKQMVLPVAKNSEAIRVSVSASPFPFPRTLDVENGGIQEQFKCEQEDNENFDSYQKRV